MKFLFFLKKVGIILNYLSSIWIIFLYAYFFVVAIKVGHLPSFSFPDPKEVIPIHNTIHYLYFISAFIFFSASILLNIFLGIFGLIKKKRLLHYSIFILFTNILIYMCLPYIDFFGVFAWFMD